MLCNSVTSEFDDGKTKYIAYNIHLLTMLTVGQFRTAPRVPSKRFKSGPRGQSNRSIAGDAFFHEMENGNEDLNKCNGLFWSGVGGVIDMRCNSGSSSGVIHRVGVATNKEDHNLHLGASNKLTTVDYEVSNISY